MARNPPRWPKGHPKAGQFASPAKLRAYRKRKAAKKPRKPSRPRAPRERLPRELREAIEFEAAARIPWRGLADLERKLYQAFGRAGIELSSNTNMLKRAGFQNGRPIFIHHAPGFGYKGKKTFRPWDVIQILFAPTGTTTDEDGRTVAVGLDAAQMWESFSLVRDLAFLHYPFENEGLMGVYFGEKQTRATFTGTLLRGQIGWRSMSRLFPWMEAFDTVPAELHDAEEEADSPYYDVAMFGLFVKIVSEGRQ